MFGNYLEAPGDYFGAGLAGRMSRFNASAQRRGTNRLRP